MKKPNREKEDRRALRQKSASKNDWEEGIGACQFDEQLISRLFPNCANCPQPHNLVLDIGASADAELAEGLHYSKQFTSERTPNETLKVYDEVIK